MKNIPDGNKPAWTELGKTCREGDSLYEKLVGFSREDSGRNKQEGGGLAKDQTGVRRGGVAYDDSAQTTPSFS